MPQASNTIDMSDPDVKEALEAYQAYQADKAQRAQNIAHPTPDAADKAASAKAPQALSLLRGGAAHQDIQDLEQMPQGIKDATARGIIGVGTAVAGGAEAQGAGMLARTAINAGGAGLQQYLGNLVTGKPDATEGVLGATATGGGLSVIGDALGGIYGAVKRPIQTWMNARNPAGLLDEARGAIADATDKLRSSQADNVRQQLQGKTLAIDTTRIRGIHPEIDSILDKTTDAYGQIPSVATVPAEDANKIRSILDQEMSYRKMGPFAQQNAEVAARDAQIKPLADNLRGQIHALSPKLSDTFDQWSDNLNQARALEGGAARSPVGMLASPSLDRQGLLQKVDGQVGTSLQDLGVRGEEAQQLALALATHRPIRIGESLAGPAVTGAYKGATQGNPLSSPAVLQSLFGTINTTQGQ